MDPLVSMQCSAGKTLGRDIHVDATGHALPNQPSLRTNYEVWLISSWSKVEGDELYSSQSM